MSEYIHFKDERFLLHPRRRKTKLAAGTASKVKGLLRRLDREKKSATS